MKTCKYPLPDNHTGIAEIVNGEVILYIENNRRIFFNLIDWFDRVTPFEVFTLSTKDDDRGVDIERMLHGHIGRYQLRYRNIDTFDIKAELNRMYSEYTAEKKRLEAWEKKINNFTCI